MRAGYEEFGSGRILEDIRRRLSSENFADRSAAVTDMLRYAGSSDVDPHSLLELMDLALHVHIPFPSRNALPTIVYDIVRRRDANVNVVLDFVERWLSSEEKHVRETAVYALVALSGRNEAPMDRLLRNLTTCIGDSHSSVRLGAFEALKEVAKRGDVNAEEIMPLIERGLADKSPAVRNTAAVVKKILSQRLSRRPPDERR